MIVLSFKCFGICLHQTENPVLCRQKSDHQMNNLELLSLEIKPKKARYFFVSWYRPPTANVDDGTFRNLRAVLMRLDWQDKGIILIGDTNCDLMDNINGNTI